MFTHRLDSRHCISNCGIQQPGEEDSSEATMVVITG